MSAGTRNQPPPAPPAAVPPAPRRRVSGWLVVLALLALVLGAGYLRGALLWPQRVGLLESPYDDEGVYAAAAQLLAQGYQPYRDFFYAHPPLGPLCFVPAVVYHFTPWGSPTSFLMARYLSLVYSALTIGAVFLLGWRLWGLAGGLFAGLLLAFDPTMVWIGRHVMLEAPLFLLAALAALAYVLAREREPAPGGWLALVGLLAATASAIKVQGLLVLAALALDLLARRRWREMGWLVAGTLPVWLALAGYLVALRDANPLGQFVWFQLVRPGDGVRGLVPRLALLVGDGRLVLVGALLALPTLALLGRSTGRFAATRLPAGLSLLLWWLGLGLVMLLLARSFYAHYLAHLALPLALLAGALPAALARSFTSGGIGRALASGLGGAAVLAVLASGRPALASDLTPHPDALYAIVGRYAGDAVQPSQTVFALDAQFPFRAARQPAREARDRFIVDGYGMLLYHGLGIEGKSMLELARRALSPLPADPYAVMWRPAAQEQLKASIARSDLVVLDTRSDARLSDDTRRWLATRGALVEKQERYAIYRIAR